MLGAALGFGAQRIVQDLLSGFFLITEKQYGFGDLVAADSDGGDDARGTVEDVTLRVTKLRTSDGEVFTVPNGQIVKSLNLSKDWARAVVDIPVPTSADINLVNEALREVSTTPWRTTGCRTCCWTNHSDGCREHRARHRQPADGGANVARQAVRGRPPTACAHREVVAACRRRGAEAASTRTG